MHGYSPLEMELALAGNKAAASGEDTSTSDETGLCSALDFLWASGMFLWFSLMCLVSFRMEPDGRVGAVGAG